jgi:hypothetical protein
MEKVWNSLFSQFVVALLFKMYLPPTFYPENPAAGPVYFSLYGIHKFVFENHLYFLTLYTL